MQFRKKMKIQLNKKREEKSLLNAIKTKQNHLAHTLYNPNRAIVIQAFSHFFNFVTVSGNSTDT